MAALADASARDRQSERARWGRLLAATLSAQATAYLFLPTIVSLQTGTIVWAQLGITMTALAVETPSPRPRGSRLPAV
jgi:hypothetical protein